METILGRYKNLIVLAMVLFAQVVGLAIQVRRPTESGSTRLIRVWTVTAVTPLQKLVVATREWTRHLWHDYLYLRNVRAENTALHDQITQMRLEEIRLAEDASQARRLQALLGFKEQVISQTLAAQVVSSTGSEFSRAVYIDKGSQDGVKQDMPVITSYGIVGKVLHVYPSSSLVLLIDDASSGVGVILERSRLQGILKGTTAGETVVHNIMKDEDVKVGENILTSGGDGVYPKGLKVGTVMGTGPGPDIFMTVKVKPAASLNRLEEVLVITKVEEKQPELTGTPVPRQRAADILAERLPSIPVKPPDESAKPAGAGTTLPAPATAHAAGNEPKPAVAKPSPDHKPKANPTPGTTNDPTKDTPR